MAEKHPKRPRDPNQLAKMITDIATGDVKEGQQAGKTPVAQGRKGGSARAKALTPEQRSEIASIAASARWKKS
jgi:hypothetical protein